MNIERARELIAFAQTALNEAQIELCEPEPIAPPPLATADELNAALATATPGTVLRLALTLEYSAALTIKAPGVTLESETPPEGRMSRDTLAPRFDRGLTVTAADVTLIGLDIRDSAGDDILIIAGARCTVDRCRVLGDPVSGAKRGIAANSDGDCKILRCYVDECFGPYPGNDCQAICAWNMLPGLVIEDCFLCGGTETVMIGGGDAASPERDPRDITIRGNTITKNPAWQAQKISCKNTLELKNARQVLIENNEISYTWGGKGQDGYLLVFTVRNQDGRDPTATIQDVTFTRNRCTCAGSLINILGLDNNHPSVKAERITIRDNVFDAIDRSTYAGSNKLIQITAGPADLTITGNTILSTGHTSTIYFAGGPPLDRFTWTGNSYPSSRYGMYGMNCEVNKAFDTYVASGVTSPNTEL